MDKSNKVFSVEFCGGPHLTTTVLIGEGKKKFVIIKQENPIYFKLGHYESIKSKKDLLILESSFLNILKMMRGYNLLRTEELKIK